MGVDAVCTVPERFTLRKPFPEPQDAETAIRVAYTGIPGAGTAVGYGLEDGGGCSSSPSMGRDFSSLHAVQTDSEAHPTSYPLGTGGPFLFGGKVTGA
jgi:hypothetical protein